MVWGSEHLLVLCLFGKFGWEDFTLDVAVRSDVGDRKSDALVHELCVQILSLDFLLSLSGQELDGIWIWESSHTFLLLRHFPEVGLLTLDLVVDENCR